MSDQLSLHNTLTGREQTFIPLRAGECSFYTCGPTVYDFTHIGNFRSFLAADLLRRWLESPLCARTTPDATPEQHPFGKGGYRVRHVMNITDVGHMTDDSAADGGGEDKMEAARKRLAEAKKSGTLPPGVDVDPADPLAVADYYRAAFVEDARALALKVVLDADSDPSLLPRATDHIRHMLALILELIERNHAYVDPQGVVYFDTQSFPDYGRLSGNTLEKIRSGAGGRVAASIQASKKHPADFMLWKHDPTHLMRWNPAGVFADAGDAERAALCEMHGLKDGYPGWHIECSAMARAILRHDEIDLHSGGEDNIFPHHECEIAQSRCATGKPHFARYWFHPRFLMVNAEKMSKSKGTFFTVRDLLARGFSPAAIRLELIKTHYRSNANFTEQGLKDSMRMVARWRAFLAKADSGSAGAASDPSVEQRFASALNDDLNISGALGIINAWINDTPSPTRADADILDRFDAVLGVLACADEAATAQSSGGPSDEEIDALLQQRAEARKNKNFAESDRIRDHLAAMNIVITDGPNGATWSRKAAL